MYHIQGNNTARMISLAPFSTQLLWSGLLKAKFPCIVAWPLSESEDESRFNFQPALEPLHCSLIFIIPVTYTAFIWQNLLWFSWVHCQTSIGSFKESLTCSDLLNGFIWFNCQSRDSQHNFCDLRALNCHAWWPQCRCLTQTMWQQPEVLICPWRGATDGGLSHKGVLAWPPPTGDQLSAIVSNCHPPLLCHKHCISLVCRLPS